MPKRAIARLSGRLLASCLILSLPALPAGAAVLDVPGSHSTIQGAVAAAVDGDTVLVDDGVYRENISFLGKNIVVASRYLLDRDPNHIRNTIIDGSDPADPDTASCVRICNGEGADAVLEGFTLTGGAGTEWRDPQWPAYLWRGGGGVFIFQASPVIRHNRIVHNSALNPGDVDGAQGGGVVAYGGDPLIRNNAVLWNEAAYGGGVVLDYSDGRIRNNLVCGNASGAIYGGGGFFLIGDGSETMLVENNTVAGNTSENRGGAFFIWTAAVTARNNILWNNTQALGNPIRLRLGGTVDLTYSDVEGGYAGEGNIDEDPDFAGPGDYLLSSDSPCVDAGDSAAAYDDPEDPGDPGSAFPPALGGLRNDMGAYGGPGCAYLVTGDPTGVGERGRAPSPREEALLLHPNVPNPFNPSTEIRWELPEPGEALLSIHDAAGRRVTVLFRGRREAGVFRSTWNGKDGGGRAVASGVYFAHLRAGARAETRKMVLVR